LNTRLIILILTISSIKAFSQQDSTKEYVVLTFEMDRNKDMHGTFVYYWVAELEKYEKVNEYKEPIMYSIFLQEFYSRNQLDSCCLGKTSYPFYIVQGDDFDFPDNYSEYLGGLRKIIKDNRVKIQEIMKVWKDNYKETITVYGTAVRGQLCKCNNGGDRLLKPGDPISFPKGKFEIIPGFWTSDKRIIIFKDFSELEFTNTDYRSRK
jgi:hypothetical protein